MTPPPILRPSLRPYTQGLAPRASKRSRQVARAVWLTIDQWRWIRARGGGAFLQAQLNRLMTGATGEHETVIPNEALYALVRALRTAKESLVRAILPQTAAERMSGLDDARMLVEGCLLELQDYAAEAITHLTNPVEPAQNPLGDNYRLRPYVQSHPAEETP